MRLKKYYFKRLADKTCSCRISIVLLWYSLLVPTLSTQSDRQKNMGYYFNTMDYHRYSTVADAQYTCLCKAESLAWCLSSHHVRNVFVGHDAAEQWNSYLSELVGTSPPNFESSHKNMSTSSATRHTVGYS